MAMARQQELISDESPKERVNTDNNSLRTESKRKKFRPFRAVRNMFRKRMRRQGSENLQDYKKSRSTTELQSDQEGSRRFSSPNSSYAVGLSVSHDSIFSPDHVATSLDPQELRNIHGFLSVQHVELKDLKTELFARVRARRDSDDEDAGLPHSPCTSPTTADILSQNLKSKGGISHTTCSAGSLISMGSSENDEDLTGQTLSSHSSRMSLSDRKFADSDDIDVSQSVPLSHKAARHRIAVRPKRTHGLPRHRKQQLAASGLGSLPSTPEISEDSGRPSSESLQSSKIFFDELDNTSEGINMEYIPTSPIFYDVKNENMILSDSLKSSPESPEENSISQISNISNNSSQDAFQNLISPSATSPKWNIIESLDNAYDKLEKECVSPDSENIEKNFCECNELKSEINKENNINTSEQKNGKEAKEVFALWGVKMRRNSDIEKNEKYIKDDKDDPVMEEPFLSRWFGSRRSSHKIKKNNDDEYISPNKETNEQVLNDNLKLTGESNICDGINPPNKIEKKNLFLNLNSTKVNNEQTFKHFISPTFQNSQNEKHVEQSTTSKFKLEYSFKQVSNTTGKQVVKSSSDNCVNYSLISNTKDQRESKIKEVKTSENSPQIEKESILSKTTSNFTTWADLKRVQKEKQESTFSSTQNIGDEMQEKSFENENINKESQEESSSGNNLATVSANKNTFIENTMVQQKQNLKNATALKEENSLIQSENEKETKESESDKTVELIMNEDHQSKTHNNKNHNSHNKVKCENSNSNIKRSPSQKVDNIISPIRTWQDSINVHESNITNKISSSPNQEILPEITSNNKTGTSNNKCMSKELKSTKQDIPQFAITSNSNKLKKNASETQIVSKKLTENSVQTNQINKELVSPKSETEPKKEVNGKHFQEHTSLPQNSELFHVFARRSIKQKHIDKEKSKNSINDSSNVKGVKNNLNTENISNCVLKDNDQNITETKFQKEKNKAVQDPSLVSNGVNTDSGQLGENNSDVRTVAANKFSEKDANQEISSRPRSNTNTDTNPVNSSVSEMRTRKASVPESTKKSFLKNKQDSCEDVKTGRSINERDKSKSFKLSNSRNSSQDTKSIEENQQPAWLRLAQQRREQREQKEKQLFGSSSPSGNESNGKPSRSTKVLDMVSNFQKLQMT